MVGSSEHVNIRRGLSLRFNFTLQSINILLERKPLPGGS